MRDALVARSPQYPPGILELQFEAVMRVVLFLVALSFAPATLPAQTPEDSCTRARRQAAHYADSVLAAIRAQAFPDSLTMITVTFLRDTLGRIDKASMQAKGGASDSERKGARQLTTSLLATAHQPEAFPGCRLPGFGLNLVKSP